MPERPGPDIEPQPGTVPVLATLHITVYQDGNWAYEGPISNLGLCHHMVGLMQAELACLQYEMTRREGGQILLASGVPRGKPGGG